MKISKIIGTILGLMMLTTGIGAAAPVFDDIDKYYNADTETEVLVLDGEALIDFNCCGQIAESDPWYGVLAISDSANFECCNTFRCYHIIDEFHVLTYDVSDDTYEVLTFTQLSYLETYFFPYGENPSYFDNSGWLSSNFDEVRENI